MKIRSVSPLTIAELEVLPTHRLLAYLNTLNRCEGSIQESDWSDGEISEVEGIIFKSSVEWKSQVELVKTVLSMRPHIEKEDRGAG